MKIKLVRYITSATEWNAKMYGVVLVETESDIDKMYELLCKQDDYWEGYKNLIKVAPKEINKIEELADLCEWAGKTDIYNMSELREQINFILYQYYVPS